MAVIRYADRYRCNACGAEADGAPVYTAASWPHDTLPAAWTAAMIAPPDRVPVSAHLCADCSNSPFRDVLGQLAEA